MEIPTPRLAVAQVARLADQTARAERPQSMKKAEPQVAVVEATIQEPEAQAVQAAKALVAEVEAEAVHPQAEQVEQVQMASVASSHNNRRNQGAATMARKALIQISTGLVLNVISLPDNVPYEVNPGVSLIDGEGASTGDTWDGSNFITPAPPPPDPVIVRRGELEARLLNSTASLQDIREYLINRHNIIAPEV